MTSTPDPDQVLIAAHDLARAALLEITSEASVGEPAGYSVEDDGVISLRFENRLGGYPGWFWTVSVARVDDAEPTVLEVELLPGDDALLAPDWVPWAVRLADYQAAQALLAEANGGDEGDEEDEDDDEDGLDADLDDVDDLDASDFDGVVTPILHAGDLDGVDIDELDEQAPEADDDFDDDASDDDAAEDDDFDDDDDAGKADVSAEDDSQGRFTD